MRARLLIGGAVLVAALAVGGVAWARSSGGSPAYRTAAVTRGAVTSALNLAGTIEPLQAASVGFAQSGTVASVDVTVGQTVTAGQTLAQLDLTALDAKLTQAQATEATARQTLAEAEAGQLPSGGGSGSGGGSDGSGSGGSGPGGSGSGGSGSGGSGSSTGTAALNSAQQAVRSAQQAVDQSQSAARSAVSGAGSACGAGADPTTCATAEAAALRAENDLSTRQNALASAESALAQQLSTAAKTATSSAAGSTSTTTVSAAQLADYQAALDADTAAVGVAQQNLGQGTAVSPLSGTVVSVGLAPGDSVTAASSTQVIVISSPNGFEVDATVPAADIASVKVGQRASVAPDGGSGTLPASVTSISSTATSSGFPVVLGLSGTDSALRQGASAAVTLTTGSVADGVVVPTSAVHTLGTRHVVEVMNGGSVQPALVTVGVMGPLHTQVVSGLKVGQRVVLADLSSTVTSDSSTTTGTRTGLTGGGGFGGGAGFAGRTGAGLVRRTGG